MVGGGRGEGIVKRPRRKGIILFTLEKLCQQRETIHVTIRPQIYDLNRKIVGSLDIF